MVYAKLQKHDKAIADFTEAIRLDPKRWFIRGLRAGAYYEKKEYDKAISDYTEAIRLDPKNATVYSARATVYAVKGEHDKAIRDNTEVIHLDPKDAGAHVCRGISYRATQRYKKAADDFLLAVWLDDKNAEAHNWLAWVRATCPMDSVRDGKEAVHHATTACELSGWKNTFYVSTLAAAFAEAGDFKQAVKWQKKAIELDSADKALLEEDRQVLKLYEQGKPYRVK